MILREPHVQTIVARYVAAYASEKLQTEVRIERFFLGIDLSVQIKNLEINDLHQNPLIRAGQLGVSVWPGDFTRHLQIEALHLADAQVRLVQYAGEEDLNYQFIADFFSKQDTLNTDTATRVYPIKLESLKLEDVDFSYVIESDTMNVVNEMDYNNIVLRNIFLRAQDISVVGDTIRAGIRKLQAIEKSGIELKNLETDLELTSQSLKADKLRLQAGQSSINGNLNFSYDGFEAFLDFINEVKIDAVVEPSSLYLADIGVFAPVMYEMPDLIAFSGTIHGTVADFETGGMSFSFADNTVFEGRVSMKGLPDFFTSDIDLIVNRFETTAADIRRFFIPIEGGMIPLPEVANKAGTMSISGSFNGRYEDFRTHLLLQSEIGKVKSDLVFRVNPRTGMPHYNLSASVERFNLGELSGQQDMLGTLTARIKAFGKGFDPEAGEADVNVDIQSLEFAGNTFTNIPIKASLKEQLAMIDFSIQHQALVLNSHATGDFTEDPPLYEARNSILFADLNRLNLMGGDTINRIAADVNTSFAGTNIDSLTGYLQIDHLRYVQGEKNLRMKNLRLDLYDDVLLGRRMEIESDFLNFEMGGKFHLASMAVVFTRYFESYINFNKPTEQLSDRLTNDSQDFFFNLRLKDLNPLMPFISPAITIAPDASFSGVFTQHRNLLNSTFQSKWIDIGGVKFESPYLLIQSDEKAARLNLELQDLIFSEAAEGDSIDFGMEHPRLSLEARHDSVDIALNWSNNRQRMLNKGNINGLFYLDSLKTGILSFNMNDVVVNDSSMQLNSDNSIIFTNEATRIHNLKLQYGQSFLGLEGNIPLREQDSLLIDFSNWNLSAFDVITGTAGFDLDGIINGDLLLNNVAENPFFTSNIHISNLGLNKEKLGDARIISNWSNADQSIYANVQVVNTGNVSNSRMLNLRGFYFPQSKTNNFSFEIALENFKLRVLNQFFEGIISKLEGLASGDFTLTGLTSKPVIAGKLELARTSFLIDYLNVKYSLQHKFEIQPGFIPVEGLTLYDTAGKKAEINGMITHNYLSDWAFDIDIKPSTLLALNTGPKQNELFYGSAVASGDVKIQGPLNNINMTITALSEKGTSIVIPLNTAGTAGNSDFIRFVNAADDFSKEDTLVTPAASSSEMGFNINLNTAITPDASVKIFLPYDMGTLEARGEGNIALGVNDAGNFTLNGDYFVQDGLFTFTFENLLKKRFNLMEGGRITWTGDPYEADLDVKGVYRVKASLAGLGLDTTSSLRNRVNVDCIIHLTNGLFNPDIKFSFALPGSDPDVEQKVFSVIDTTNDATMTQQMVSLLVLGSFSTTNLGNSSLTNSTFEMLSGQLSGLLSQISKDFDIGLNYRPGDELTNEELEVALSTQLFNDRVSIEGNFGVSNNRNVSQSASNIVGDVDVNVKLNRDGSFRMKAFNHSNHSSWLNYGIFDNYSPYTQGVGLSYRQEFDAFREVFVRKKKKKQSVP